MQRSSNRSAVLAISRTASLRMLIVVAAAVDLMALSPAIVRADPPSFSVTATGTFDMEDMYYDSPVMTSLNWDSGSLMWCADEVAPELNAGCLLGGTAQLTGLSDLVYLDWDVAFTPPDDSGIMYFSGSFVPTDEAGVVQDTGYFGSIEGELDTTTDELALTLNGAWVTPPPPSGDDNPPSDDSNPPSDDTGGG